MPGELLYYAAIQQPFRSAQVRYIKNPTMTHAITSATRQAINSRSVPVFINCRIISNVFAMSKTNAAMPAAIFKSGGRKGKEIPNNQ